MDAIGIALVHDLRKGEVETTLSEEESPSREGAVHEGVAWMAFFTRDNMPDHSGSSPNSLSIALLYSA